jgi:hypothetical protein
VVRRENDRIAPIETPDFTFWMGEDGILRLRFAPGRDLGLEIVKKSVEIGGGIFQKHPCPLLCFLDEVKSMTREARSYVSKMPGPTAVGLVVSSPIARAIGGMFIGLVRRAPYSVRMFATEEKAAEWLAGFRQAPRPAPSTGGRAMEAS